MTDPRSPGVDHRVWHPQRVRGALFAGAAVGLTVIVAALAVEIALRVFHLAPFAGVGTVSESDFPMVPGIFGPGQEIVDRQRPALPFGVRINSLGYRGHDVSLQKAAGELRVLAIGDSFTYGDFVDDELTLPAQLEKQLSRRCNRPVTVINAGVGGTTIDTHLEMMRRGWMASPDIVLLTFSENDVTDLRDSAWVRLAANRRAKSRFPLSIAYPVLRHLAVWHFGLEVRARIRARHAPPAPASASPGEERSEIDALRTEYRRLLLELAAEVHGRQATLVLAAFPSHWTVKGVRSAEQLSWLEQTAAEAGISTVSLLRPLQASGQPVESLYLLPHDGHASPRGNEVAVGAVAERFAALGLCGGQR